MNYCIICQKITNNYEETSPWSRIFKLITVHCEECGHFKYQYLNKGIEIQSAD